MYYPTDRNISFLICLLCCKVDFSELSLHLNSTDQNRVLFYTMQKIRSLSLFSELGSFLICIYTIGPWSNKVRDTERVTIFERSKCKVQYVHRLFPVAGQ